MMSEARYTYKKHGHSPYYGKCLMIVEGASGGSFRISEHYIVVNEKGELGHIGAGTKWFLNYVAGDGGWCFNPLKAEDIVWSHFHNAYVYKSQQEHFHYPACVGEFYQLKDGVKAVGGFYGVVVPKLPYTRFSPRSPYL